MKDLARLGGILLALVASTACDNQRLSQCQELVTRIADSGSAIMQHRLESPGFERVLSRVDRGIAELVGITELDDARHKYESRMREAIQLAGKGSVAMERSSRIDANASARARAAQATYYFLESTNLHCAGER